ncbi:MAG: Glu-tRNA(Gln) amidotransferase subunit GatE [Methanobacteriota archaeon]
MKLDYEKIGFKCGIEIHQQLDTHKLFCACPSVIRDEKPDFVVERRMRAVAGEMGAVDPAALHEFLKNRRLYYETYTDTNCLVELDEEPPHPLNEQALSTALTVALMLSAKPVSEIQVMRKTVIDGSNTSGFQRTILVGMGGVLKTSMGDVGISSVCLEEDAARIIEDKDDVVTYRLDRLGIPLVEVATDPDIKSPEHAREVAEKIGMILRATARVKRGLGTIRQDLNVSIKGGQRIEAKGVQELRAISKLCENEVRRQLALIDIKGELSSRKVKPSDVKADFIEVSECFKGDDRSWIQRSLKEGGKVYAMRLPIFHGLLSYELMPDHRFGTELSHVAKASAGVGGVLHSEEDSNKKISSSISKKLKVLEKDAWVAIVSNDDLRVENAFKAIALRCQVAFKGVPKETRRPEGEITVFMRPLPGSDRMYPETDEPLVNTSNLVYGLKGNLPKLPEEKRRDYEKMGLSPEMANQLNNSPSAKVFAVFVKEFPKLPPTLIAQMLLSTTKEAKKRFGSHIENLTLDHFRGILNLVADGSITKDVIVEVIRNLSETPEKNASDVVSEKKIGSLSGEKLSKLIDSVYEKNSGVESVNKFLGLVMAEAGGRANPSEVRKIIEYKKLF